MQFYWTGMRVQLLSSLLYSFSLDMHVCTASFTVASHSLIGHARVYSSFCHLFLMQFYWTGMRVQLLPPLLHSFSLDMHVCAASFTVASRSLFIEHSLVYSSVRCCFMQFYRTCTCAQLLSSL